MNTGEGAEEDGERSPTERHRDTRHRVHKQTERERVKLGVGVMQGLGFRWESG